MTARRQRGVALLVALLVVALATLLIAALLDRGQLALARSHNVLRSEQASAYARGLESYAAAVLARDDNGIDTRDDLWAMPLPPTPVPGGLIGATMADRNGCFNLNNLVIDGVPQTLWIARYRRLLVALKLTPTIADATVDWLDPDSNAAPTGAEASTYGNREPAYRAANRPFTDASELRLVAGIDGAAWSALAPYVCALPTPTVLNLNTAPVPVLMSLADGITAAVAARVYRDGHADWQDLDQVAAELARAGVVLDPAARRGLGFRSDYFLARAGIRLDGIEFSYQSLLQRRAGIRVLERTRGL
ncbi:MAG TPA: type II secretion system minor pseudopilin GspK [Rhodanobacteraceae bacterium]|nr:type II secretion system minor pseudopilin GspK [Rhodanobacteraceae bacterium]